MPPDDHWSIGRAVQRLLEVAFQEWHLVLDDEDLLQVAGHGDELLRVEREGHPQPDQPDAELLHGVVIDAEIVQGALKHRERGARCQQAQRGP
ncbi:hypothetical protein [Streptomyces sp. KL116D]|uniref:hypothetical protein n=1 Tax=Streptomyces sp. KL116D TaxID=3045152 RepID=UPI003559216B